METMPQTQNLIQLPFQKNVYLCYQSKTRWLMDRGKLLRDSDGEAEWTKMGDYVGKSYLEVFEDSYRHAMQERK